MAPDTAGNGPRLVRTFDVSGFQGVELATAGDLEIVMGLNEALRAEADARTLDLLEAEVHDGMLTIRTQRGAHLHRRSPVRLTLTARALDSVLLSGSGTIDAPDLAGERVALTVSGSGDVRAHALNADRSIAIEVSGAGNVTASRCTAPSSEVVVSGAGEVRMDGLRAESLSTTISGSGSVRPGSGSAARQAVMILGSGDYMGQGLESTEVEVGIFGSGTVHVWAPGRLDVRISGSGDVRYTGQPQLTVRRSGSGRVVNEG